MHSLRPLITPIENYRHDHELLAENTLTQARDYCASERTFLSGVKLTISMAVIGGYLFMKMPSDYSRTMDIALGSVLFALAFLFTVVTLTNYFKAIRLLREEETKSKEPILIMLSTFIVGLFALAMSVTELVVEPSGCPTSY